MVSRTRTGATHRPQAASPAAFEHWYRAHHHRLRAYCAGLLGDPSAAEDVAQEALARAWARRGSFASDEHVAAWLWRVARNLCMDIHRSRARVLPAPELPEEPDHEADPLRPLEAEEDRRAVRAALSGLSPRHRELLYLREVRGAGYEELASRLGLSPEGVRAVLFRARRSLREALRAAGHALGVAPLAAYRRMAAMIRRVGLSVESRRPPLAAELAAATIAAVSSLGPPVPRGPAPPVPPPPPAAATALAAAPAASSAAHVVAASPPASSPQAGGLPSPPAAAAPSPPRPPDWHAGLAVGGRRDDPDSGLVRVSVTAERASPDPSEDPGLLSRLPSADLGILQSPPR